MKYLTRLFHKKGFTLTELIIVIAIVGILMLSLVTFSGPVRLMVQGTDAKSECITINNTIGQYLEHTLAYANDIRIYSGVTIAGSALAEINKDYKAVQDTYKTANDRSGMIIFHYVRNTDKLKSGYRIYELLSKDSDGKTLAPTARTIANDDGSSDTVYDISDNKLLFYNDFYGPYCFFLEADSSPTSNVARDNMHLKATLRSYYFDGSSKFSDGTDMYIKTGDFKSHYHHVADVANNVTPPTEDLTERFLGASCGQEGIFFSLENSKSPVANIIPTNFHLGFTDSGGTTTYGDDVVIIYNIRKYTFSS